VAFMGLLALAKRAHAWYIRGAQVRLRSGGAWGSDTTAAAFLF